MSQFTVALRKCIKNQVGNVVSIGKEDLLSLCDKADKYDLKPAIEDQKKFGFTFKTLADPLGQIIEKHVQEVLARENREKDSLIAAMLTTGKYQPRQLVICTGPHPTRPNAIRT